MKNIGRELNFTENSLIKLIWKIFLVSNKECEQNIKNGEIAACNLTEAVEKTLNNIHPLSSYSVIQLRELKEKVSSCQIQLECNDNNISCSSDPIISININPMNKGTLYLYIQNEILHCAIRLEKKTVSYELTEKLLGTPHYERIKEEVRLSQSLDGVKWNIVCEVLANLGISTNWLVYGFSTVKELWEKLIDKEINKEEEASKKIQALIQLCQSYQTIKGNPQTNIERYLAILNDETLLYRQRLQAFESEFLNDQDKLLTSHYDWVIRILKALHLTDKAEKYERTWVKLEKIQSISTLCKEFISKETDVKLKNLLEDMLKILKKNTKPTETLLAFRLAYNEFVCRYPNELAPFKQSIRKIIPASIGDTDYRFFSPDSKKKQDPDSNTPKFDIENN